MKTLVCLVSRQVMANLIPIISLGVETAELLYTSDEYRAFTLLKQAVRGTGLAVTMKAHKVEPYDFKGIQALCKKLIAEKQDIMLNATGGTKIMAFAAFSVFYEAKKPVFYLDSFHNKAIQFHPYRIASHPVKISLDVMLAAHGYQIIEYRKSKTLEKRKSLVKYLGRFYYQIAGCLAQYRRFMHEKNWYFPPITLREVGFEICRTRDRKIAVTYGNNSITIDDYDYLDGLWLEELVYWLIHKKGWDDLRVGVSLSYHGWNNQDTPLNEVDLIGIKNGKLYLFSCKSGITKDKQDIFELEALRTLAGGTYGKAYFITSTPVRKEKHIYERCGELKIPIFDHTNFMKIKDEAF